MNRMDHQILVLDGHDGAGKTTLARRLAQEIAATYLRPYGGTAGEVMLWSAETGDQGSAAVFAKKQIEYALSRTPHGPVIMDRGWLTLFTLLSDEGQREWTFRPPTVLCHAGVAATLQRLEQRSEEEKSESYHRHYIGLYEELAARHGCPVLRTDLASEDECLAWLCEHAIAHLALEASAR